MAVKSVSDESIVSAAIDLIRSGGWTAVSARAIARKLRRSTMPIYSSIGSMDNLRAAATAKVAELLSVEQSKTRTGNESLDLAVGYIAFAREQPALFRFLTSIPRDSFGAEIRERPMVAGLLGSIADASGRGDFLLRSWVFTHGLADLIASGAVTLTESEIIRHLSAAGGAFLREQRRRGPKENVHD